MSLMIALAGLMSTSGQAVSSQGGDAIFGATAPQYRGGPAVLSIYAGGPVGGEGGVSGADSHERGASKGPGGEWTFQRERAPGILPGKT